MGIEGGITVEMNEQEQKQIVSRLRRLAGQAKSLETVLLLGDNTKFVGQLQAVIAAGQATLGRYTALRLIGSEDEADKKLLERLIRKS